MPNKLMTMHGDQRHSVIVDNTRRSIHAWQDGVRNPSLTVLLVLELCAVFLAAPLAAKGLPIARAVAAHAAETGPLQPLTSSRVLPGLAQAEVLAVGRFDSQPGGEARACHDQLTSTGLRGWRCCCGQWCIPRRPTPPTRERMVSGSAL